MDPVLVVDDEKDNLEAIKRLLRSHYDVTTTDSPKEALELIRTQAFNVIISDQRMPEMTGVELLEKSKEVLPNTTRILLTGYTDIDSVIGAINRGNIYRYIAKPWDPDDLTLTLRQANEAYLLRQEVEQKNRALARSNDELKRALHQLTLLDKAKARFLALVSHELNTPLTVLMSFVQLLGEYRKDLPEEVSKAIQSIDKAGNRFGEIIHDVITFVKLESGESSAEGSLDLNEATVNATKALEEIRRKGQVGVKLRSVSDPVAKGDAEHLGLAIQYLLKDAFSRTPKGDQVLVEIGKKDRTLQYKITRGGEPLDEAVLKPMEFSGDVMHHHQNLGLSLSICRLVVERLGGRIWVDNSDKTSVIFQVPATG